MIERSPLSFRYSGRREEGSESLSPPIRSREEKDNERACLPFPRQQKKRCCAIFLLIVKGLTRRALFLQSMKKVSACLLSLFLRGVISYEGVIGPSPRPISEEEIERPSCLSLHSRVEL